MPDGLRFTKVLACRSRVGACGSEYTTQMRYRQAKETKCVGMGRGKSELLIVCAGQRTDQEG